MLTRMKTPSPSLFRKGTPSPRSPCDDICPPTPAWTSLPPRDPAAKNTSFDHAAMAQIAWTAYQNCSRRMNGACVVNRSLSREQQRQWWTESSRICLNAILLHRATMARQTSVETQRQLAALENAYHIVQTMLESLAKEQQLPIEDVPEFTRSASVSTASTLFDDEDEDEDEEKEEQNPMPEKRHKQRLALSTMVDRVIGLVSPKEQKMETQKMDCPEAVLY